MYIHNRYCSQWYYNTIIIINTHTKKVAYWVERLQVPAPLQVRDYKQLLKIYLYMYVKTKNKKTHNKITAIVSLGQFHTKSRQFQHLAADSLFQRKRNLPLTAVT